MQITKLVLDNFSSYEGETVFDFTVKKKQPIVLIGGLNGAGKTSIFTAIKIALYGPLAFGYTGNNAFYSKKIRGFINDKAFQTQPFSSGISIEIKIKKERETKHYNIIRNWTIVDSKIEEEYNIYEGKTLLNYSEKILFESYILNIIPIDLFEFFLFDGEEVGNIFSSDGYNKYVKNALLIGYNEDKKVIFTGKKENIKSLSAFRLFCNSVVFKDNTSDFYKIISCFLEANDEWLSYGSVTSSDKVISKIYEETYIPSLMLQKDVILGVRFWINFLGFGFFQESHKIFLPNMYTALKDFMLLGNIEKGKESKPEYTKYHLS